MDPRILDYIALGLLVTIAITFVYVIIYIHDIPYNIAKKRNHPHQDAIHTAGWVSLFLMHAIWPFLWIWATLYHEDKGFGLENKVKKDEEDIELLKKRIDELEKKISIQKEAK